MTNFGCNDLTDLNILHSSTAVCATYLILTILGSTGLSVIITLLFNMTYLLYGKAIIYRNKIPTTELWNTCFYGK